MAQTIQNGIRFDTIYKDGGVRISDTLIQSSWNANAEYPSDDNYPIVNAVDIDWNGAEVGEETIINTTGELLCWIKNNILSSEDREYLELLKQIISVIKLHNIDINNNDNNIEYWYAGSTIPSASNIKTIATGSVTAKPNWTAENPQSIATTNSTNSATYLYYCFPTEWHVVTLDVDKVTEMQLVNVKTFTYNGTEYTILRTGRTIAVGTTKNYWAKC